MADPHAHAAHDRGSEHATGAGGWVSTFVLSLGGFLLIWLTVLYIGHTLAGPVSD
ncbi:MAG TPA: hypothetical protein VEI82_05890 [Myxococcota bacterium]|nr:hypothetical protein [Myxococcota bacterium]